MDVFQKIPERLGEGRYAVGPLIRAGTMSRVHRGVQLATGTPVALKILEGGFANAELRKRFVAEIRALSELDHPRIVKILAAGRDGALTWFALEYCAGGSLREALVEGGAASPRVAARWTVEMLDGLHAAHLEDVIHRDVKPSNMLLDSEGRVKLADFGVAHHPEGKVAFRTMQGAQMGSDQYTAPECRQDASAATVRSDVYSAGVTLYELMSAAPPIWLATRAKRADALAKLPEVFRPVVDRATALEQGERYESAEALRDAVIAAADSWSRDHGEPADGASWRVDGGGGLLAWFRKKLS